MRNLPLVQSRMTSVRSPFQRIPIVDASQKRPGRERLNVDFAKLPRPWHACGWVRPWAARFVFRKARCLFARGIAPVVPTFRLDMRVHPAIDKNNAAIRSPGTTQVNPSACICPGQPAIQKNESICLRITEPPMRGDIARSFAVYRAIYKNRGGVSED